ncbi:MAG: DUF3592 domain-containing protein [Chloroflexi bacterium]|nr:DUF3592 domain-containing protein [Chloroflexota bacterium]MCI0578558.1 DUF3592 domain-containing protein [Chloroflexota bacterium]MCI0645078.1 DUF3592 domain-containing protein [Chloroflexota bacterium]MCI0731913.1 DUF3592 domain-containing protein [Chloroflexota bacterium]
MDPNELIPWITGGGVIITIISVAVGTLCTLVSVLGPIAAIFWFIRHQGQKASTIRQASQSWLSTTGVIVKSRVEVSGGDHASVSPHVVYEYSVGGQTYQGKQIRAGDSYFNITNSRQAYDTVDRYPAGNQVIVYYNPANPAEAALER